MLSVDIRPPLIAVMLCLCMTVTVELDFLVSLG
jgi:hypothetical protein